MDNDIPTFDEYLRDARPLHESSLSRVYRQNLTHDCGALTAFRSSFSHDENRARNRSLLAKLMAKRYSVTSIYGRYPETLPNGQERSVKEESFFVVDIQQTGQLEADLKSLGELFDQDSVLIIPKGAVEHKAQAYLVGTNHTGFVGYGQTLPFERGRFGYGSPIYTSYVNGRPFIFEEAGVPHEYPGSGFGHWALQVMSQREWKTFIQ